MRNWVKGLLLIGLAWTCTVQAQVAPEKARLFAFGLVADVQAADKDSGSRHYRETPARLAACVADWNTNRLQFVVQLGDLIEGYPRDQQKSREDYVRLLGIYTQAAARAYSALGNHCVSAGRPWLLTQLGLSQAYYDFTNSAPPAGASSCSMATIANWAPSARSSGPGCRRNSPTPARPMNA